MPHPALFWQYKAADQNFLLFGDTVVILAERELMASIALNNLPASQGWEGFGFSTASVGPASTQPALTQLSWLVRTVLLV